MTCGALVVAGPRGFGPFHLRREGSMRSLCGAVAGHDGPGIGDWGLAPRPRSLDPRWCGPCHRAAIGMGHALRAEALAEPPARAEPRPPYYAAFMRRWPLLYADWFRPVGTTPLWQFGIECGPGWASILMRVSTALEAEISAMREPGRTATFAAQAKPKFGELRLYMDGDTTPAMERAICDAVVESRSTCGDCGARRGPGHECRRT